MEKEFIEQLKKEGYRDVGAYPFPANHEFTEHTHDEHTVHIILEGQITMIEKTGDVVLNIGDRYEIPKGTTHSAKAGPQGVTFIVGFK